MLIDSSHVEATEKDHSSLNTKAARIKAVNEHSLLVQEFFQKRVEDFLNTYGRDVLGIKHYWVRYEFAKGRGQIHAHLLAITDDAFEVCLQKNESTEQRTSRVTDWAQKKFGLTATHPATDSEGHLNLNRVKKPEGTLEKDTFSIKTRAFEQSNMTQDAVNLCNCCQMHECSSYCMRNSTKRKQRSVSQGASQNNQNAPAALNQVRFCRFGAGDECENGKADTPGFEKTVSSKITNDARGFNKLELPRNTARMTQSSLKILQPWRGNCDLQIILYNSPSDDFDFLEIARVTDYVVGYACKGNNTLQVEKDNIKATIMG